MERIRERLIVSSDTLASMRLAQHPLLVSFFQKRAAEGAVFLLRGLRKPTLKPPSRHDAKRTVRNAFTLAELLMVLFVVALLAGLIVPMFAGAVDNAEEVTTKESMRVLQELILNRYRLDMQGVINSSNAFIRNGLPGPDATNLLPTSRTNNPQLVYLFGNPTTNTTQVTFDPITKFGWRGPYLLAGRSGKYPGANSDPGVRGFDNRFGEVGDETMLDAWGNPIIININTFSNTAELLSAGPDGDLNSTTDNLSLPLR